MQALSSGSAQRYGIPEGCNQVAQPVAVALVVPLYFESRAEMDVPVVNIGVSDTGELRKRIMARDGESAVRRLDSQMSLAEREARS